MKTRLTMKSRNIKTGPIPVSTTEKNSCPDICELKNGPCYGEHGPLNIVWDEINTKKDIALTWPQFCDKVKAFPDGQFWRHNQAGDLPHKNQVIDKAKLEKLVNANFGKKGFTYTHHDTTIKENLLCIGAANIAGFTVNLSANNLKHADKLYSIGIAPVVTLLPIDQTKNLKTPNGNKVIVCPAAIDITDKINCNNCHLCQNRKRKMIIGFPSHGIKKKFAELVFLKG